MNLDHSCGIHPTVVQPQPENLNIMIGYSLSLCIVDILRDKVSLDDVTVISTGTKACDDEDWNLVLDSYSRTYWRKDPLRAREIANTLRDTGRITQPRCLGLQPVSTGDGIWSFE